MNNQDQANTATAPPTLLTKEDHIAGSKVIEVSTKWGESTKLKITALGWRAIQEILRNEDEVASSEQIIVRSIDPESLKAALGLLKCKSENLLDHLDVESAVRLQQYARAFAFGERTAAPNAPRPTAPNPPAAPALPNVAGEQSASSPPGVYEAQRWDGKNWVACPHPSSPSPSENSTASEPSATCVS